MLSHQQLSHEMATFDIKVKNVPICLQAILINVFKKIFLTKGEQKMNRKALFEANTKENWYNIDNICAYFYCWGTTIILRFCKTYTISISLLLSEIRHYVPQISICSMGSA